MQEKKGREASNNPKFTSQDASRLNYNYSTNNNCVSAINKKKNNNNNKKQKRVNF